MMTARPGERCDPGSEPPGPELDRQLGALYAQHAPALLSFVTRLTSGDSHWAEDVVQETLFRAWKTAVASGTDQPPGRSWLFTVARRIVISGIRRRSARPPESPDATALEYIADGDRIDAMLTSVTVADALAALTPPHREVILLVYGRDSAIDEAAQALGIPPGTVKSRLHYALRALKAECEERGLTPTV
jgi:RNA polymerase sigma-70 factor, ECF subfamily